MSKKAMYDLRNMLCEELDELARKGDLGAGAAEYAIGKAFSLLPLCWSRMAYNTARRS